MTTSRLAALAGLYLAAGFAAIQCLTHRIHIGAAGGQLDVHVGQLVLDRLVRADGATEGLALQGIVARHVHRGLGAAHLGEREVDRGGVVQPLQVAPTVGLVAQRFGCRVLEHQLGVLARRIDRLDPLLLDPLLAVAGLEQASRFDREVIIERFIEGAELTVAILGSGAAARALPVIEIRAPAGTLAGVSGFQLSFASTDIRTPGDQPDALVAMNPAALKVNLPHVKKGGLLILNENGFDKDGLLVTFKYDDVPSFASACMGGKMVAISEMKAKSAP